MHPERKKRALVIVFVLLAVATAIALVMYALRQNINLFYSPTQIAKGEAPFNTEMRAGGMVVEGSLVRDQNGLEVEFQVTDFVNTLSVQYNGILPDLFREGQGIVALGKLNQKGVFIAKEVLAKHDENYMPPEVADALKNSSDKGESKNAETSY